MELVIAHRGLERKDTAVRILIMDGAIIESLPGEAYIRMAPLSSKSP